MRTSSRSPHQKYFLFHSQGHILRQDKQTGQEASPVSPGVEYAPLLYFYSIGNTACHSDLEKKINKFKFPELEKIAQDEACPEKCLLDSGAILT